jgi:hypothetical protein
MLRSGKNRLYKPSVGTPIDRNVPLGQSLIVAYPFNEGGGTPTDHAGTVGVAGYATAAGYNYGNAGVLAGRNSTVQGSANTEYITLPLTLPLTITVVGAFRTFQAAFPNISSVFFAEFGNSGVSSYVRFGDAGLALNALQFGAFGGTKYVQAGKTFAQSERFAISVVYTSTSSSWYVNGQFIVTDTRANNGQLTKLDLFTDGPGNPRSPDGVIECLYVHGKGLALDEIMTLHTRPYSMFVAGSERRLVAAMAAPAGGGTILNGLASLIGVSSLQATGKALIAGSAALVGVSSLAAAGAALVQGGAAMTGIGLLTPAGVVITQATAALVGVGSLNASAGGVIPGAAALIGVSALTASGQIQQLGQAALSGVSSLSASGADTVPGQAALGSVGNLSANGADTLPGQSALAGVGNLNATGSASSGTVFDTAALSGVGSLSAAGVNIIPGGATPVGCSLVTASGSTGATLPLIIISASSGGDGYILSGGIG